MENLLKKLKEIAESKDLSSTGGKCLIIMENEDGEGQTRVIGQTGWVFDKLLVLGQADDNMAAAIKGAAAAL